MVGHKTFGLPYRYGRLEYRHHPELWRIEGCVTSPRDPGAFRYVYSGSPLTSFRPSEAGTIDEFLMERYSAFTCERGIKRRFRIWHEPWLQTPLRVDIQDASLISASGPWMQHARLIGANYTPGVHDVWVGRPCCIEGPGCSQLWPTTGP
jgi:uncharacterized protein YqjF (DUF2071 family)